ncbi:unnamed protein product [Heterobilharzia americana]|nr:unnamed protein product [Heterobilharzia americana]
MSEENLVCLLQRPSESRSQAVSYQLSKIFKHLYQFSSLDDDMVSYLQAAKESEDEKHCSYIKEVNEVLEKHRDTINAVNAAECRIRQYSCDIGLSQRSENERSMESGSSLVLNYYEMDDSFLRDFGLLTKEDIYFNGKPRIPGFPTAQNPPKAEENDYTLKPLLMSKSSVNNKHKSNHPMKNNFKNDLNYDKVSLVSYSTFSARSTASIKKRMNNNKTSFLAEPESILFNFYQPGSVYEAFIKIRNVSQTARSIRVLPPKTTYFSVNEGKFPLPGSSVIAPGMAATFLLQFRPDSLGDFEDELIIRYENQLESLFVKLLGRKSRPQLNLLECYDLGCVLKGSTKMNTIKIENSNPDMVSSGNFLFITKQSFDQYPKYDAKNFQEYYASYVSGHTSSLCLESFSLEPVQFTLEALKPVTITIEFKPVSLGEYKWELVLLCDNGQSFPVTFKGTGEELKLEIIEIMDEHVDPSGISSFRRIGDNSSDLFYFYQFPVQYPYTVAPKTMKIFNACSQSLRFQWVQQNPSCKTRCEEYSPDSLIKNDDLSNISRNAAGRCFTFIIHYHPTTGVFEPNEIKSFEIRFNPIEVGEFTTVLEMILLNIPLVDELNNCYTVDKKHLTIELKGVTESVPISIEPSILIIPGKCLPNVPLHHTIQLLNKSHNCPVAYCWQCNFDFKRNSNTSSACSQSAVEDYQPTSSKKLDKNNDIKKSDERLIILEPTMGVIAPRQSINVDIFLSSSKSMKVKEDVPCFIDILPNSPLWLHIEAEFMEPAIMFDIPDCNFGLMRLNETVRRKVVLTNTSPSSRKWFLKLDNMVGRIASEIEISPSSGILKPFQSVTVNLSFTPQLSRSVREVISGQTEDTEEISKLLILAEVQTPLIDFEPNHVNYDQCFWNIPITKMITVTNLSSLEFDLEWMDPVGNDKEWVTVTITPKCCRMSGQQSLEFEVSLCAQKQAQANDLRIPLRVNGLNELLWLPITANVHGVSLKYCLLNQESIDLTDEECSYEYHNITSEKGNTPPVLDFGQNVGLFEPVEKWIVFKNFTPIPTRICVDMGNLCSKIGYSEYENYTYKPELGAQRYLIKLSSNQSTENGLSKQTFLHKDESKTEIRNLYGWCNLLLRQSKGSCVLAHSAISSFNSSSDFRLAELHLVTIINLHRNRWLRHHGVFLDTVI